MFYCRLYLNSLIVAQLKGFFIFIFIVLKILEMALLKSPFLLVEVSIFLLKNLCFLDKKCFGIFCPQFLPLVRYMSQMGSLKQDNNT